MPAVQEMSELKPLAHKLTPAMTATHGQKISMKFFMVGLLKSGCRVKVIRSSFNLTDRNDICNRGEHATFAGMLPLRVERKFKRFVIC